MFEFFPVSESLQIDTETEISNKPVKQPSKLKYCI